MEQHLEFDFSEYTEPKISEFSIKLQENCYGSYYGMDINVEKQIVSIDIDGSHLTAMHIINLWEDLVYKKS